MVYCVVIDLSSSLLPMIQALFINSASGEIPARVFSVYQVKVLIFFFCTKTMTLAIFLSVEIRPEFKIIEDKFECFAFRVL